MKLLTFAVLSFLAPLAASLPLSAEEKKAVPPPYDPTHTAKEWVPHFAEEWWNHYHPDYEAWYPGGRSNRFHDAWLARVMKKHARSVNWEIFNRQYAFDGQWFAVEWFYRATDVDSDFRQWESTLAFARIHEGKKILWIEYFDDSVGNLQRIGMMPFFDADEPIAPWPAKAILKMPYRP
jgi:hypothetical protein